jgi:hypothetical protein
MSKLNSYWTTLLIAGIVILIGSIIWNVFQGVSGSDSDFDETIELFQSQDLIPDYVVEHLISGQSNTTGPQGIVP